MFTALAYIRLSKLTDVFSYFLAMMESTILSNKSNNGFYLRQLAIFLSFVIGYKSRWELCYRSSTHGSSDFKFHEKCDGRSNTVTIVKKNDFVFGGFTDTPWGEYSLCTSLLEQLHNSGSHRSAIGKLVESFCGRDKSGSHCYSNMWS